MFLKKWLQKLIFFAFWISLTQRSLIFKKGVLTLFFNIKLIF
ncbi:hypothetical protein N202_03115 [Helicobacter pylori UM067]|nr:hypothetical protein N202_03115 [Helicobacter pylori UM067]